MFEAYLRSLITNKRYQQHCGFYTPTDAIGELQRSQPAASALDIGLMVQLLQSRPSEEERKPREPQVQEKTERLPVLEGIRKYAANHVLLMGRPGSGKSTALARLLVEEARKALGDPSVKIPVLVELRYLDGDRPSILKRVGAFLRSHHLHLDETTLDTALTDGRLLLLMDGVNELPSDAARRAVAQFRQVDYPKTPMIFTTRDVALGGDLGIEKKLEMQPLSEQQMRQFVQTYLPQQGEAMLRQLQGRLREIGQTPLFLWMLCQVFQGLNQLPTNLGLLFRCFTEGYDKLKQDVPISEGLRHWKPELLQHLAFTMMQAEEPTELRVAIPRHEADQVLTEFLQGKVEYPGQRAKEWLEDLLEHHLIQRTSQNQLEFHHQLLQEYYAAEALLQKLPHLSDRELQRDYLNYLKWTEPFALMLALTEQESQALRVTGLAQEVDLMLGARLAGEVQPQFQEKAITWIQEFSGSELLKVEFLAITRSQDAVPGLTKALENLDIHVRRSATEALGKLNNEAAISSLIKALEDADPDVRRKVAHVLGKLNTEAVVPGLIKASKDPDYFVRRIANEALENLNNKIEINRINQDSEFYFLKSSVESFVCRSTTVSLGKLNHEAVIPKLFNALEDPDYFVRRRAAEALGNLNDKAAVPVLTKALEDADSSVRGSAAEALGKLNDKVAIPVLIRALEDSDYFVRSSAAEALGNLNGELAIPALIKALEDSDYFVRSSAAEALGKLNSKAAIPSLIKASEDSNIHVRRSVIEALEKLSSEVAIPSLIKALEDADSLIRWIAAESLGNLNNEVAIPKLLEALEDPSSDVRWIAAEALGKLNNEIAIPGLIKALEDADSNVRSSAAKALGKLNSEAAIPALIKVQEDSAPHVRWSAVESLKNLKVELAVEALIETLDHKDIYVRRDGSVLLEEIATPKILPLLYKKQLQSVSTTTYSLVIAIQNRCKFYNYNIWQAAVHYEKVKRQTPNMAEQSRNDFSGAIFNAPVNFGNNPSGDFIGTQTNYAANPEVRDAISELQTLLTELQNQYPQVTTATQALQIVDVEFTEIKQSKTHKLSTLGKQLRNPERHLQAIKAAFGEIAKHYLEDSLWAKTILTYLDKLSEEPNHGD